ncbi:hypothetical protein [uncultured Duncaniella sp.]|uniref:hypothetical protein n=1 Tax=uncultured Duncaniella sp. TaxID=2768039 RepID=UPI00265B2E82|nr:hypothetical protein [uncultured Duncaniella sp.]
MSRKQCDTLRPKPILKGLPIRRKLRRQHDNREIPRGSPILQAPYAATGMHCVRKSISG